MTNQNQKIPLKDWVFIAIAAALWLYVSNSEYLNPIVR